MDLDVTLKALRKWHDVELQQGGVVREVTKIRYFLGTNGPFEHTFDRTATDSDIERVIGEQRASLQRLASA